jgi:hypothetical protein
MSSNHHITDGSIFMTLGGRHRNMILEPFEEDEPEFPHYGEFKRQIEQLINTKTSSNIFRPAPHNKEIGTDVEERALTRRFLRVNIIGEHDDLQPPCTSEDTKNYHNMVREQAKQALADTIACDLYVSVLGKHRKAQMQTLIDDTNTSARFRLTCIKATHWREVDDHIPVIIANYKQQWYRGQVQSKDLRSAMTNLNIIQEINRQVTNFNPTQTYTGLDIITLMLPTLVATEFNQMVRDWKRSIRRDINPSLTEISDDIQGCFSIQSSVTNPDTYSFIIKPKESQYARVNNASTTYDHHDRSNSKQSDQQRRYTEEDIRSIKDKAYREGKASTHHTTHRDRSYTRPESQPQRHRYDNEKRQRHINRHQKQKQIQRHSPTTARCTKKPQRQKQKQK